MKAVYRILAYVISVEVVIQAMVAVYAIAGLDKFVAEGGVFDKAVMESDELPFPEVIGLIIHGINGMNVIPALAVLLLIASFFTRIPGAALWAALVLLLVAVQVTLGILAHNLPFLGLLHGLNALLLFTTALYTARRGRVPGRATANVPEDQVAARA